MIYVVSAIALSFMIGWESCLVFNSQRIWERAYKLAADMVAATDKAASTKDEEN